MCQYFSPSSQKITNLMFDAFKLKKLSEDHLYDSEERSTVSKLYKWRFAAKLWKWRLQNEAIVL